MLKHFLFFVVTLTLVSINNVMAYELLDPKSDLKKYKKGWNNPILLETGEKFLLNKRGSNADSVLFLIRKDYEQVKRELRKIVIKKVGIAFEDETISDEYGKYTPLLGDGVDIRIQKDYEEVKKMGINIGRFKQYEIKTNKYNVIKRIKGYSILEIKMINGKDLFKKECTLLFMVRTDHWYDWARTLHLRIPLPFKIERDVEYITNTEAGMAEELIEIMGIDRLQLQLFIPEHRFKPLRQLKLMKAVKEEVDKF